ncbi:uncharacterized protein N7500_006339 [Penicillium coprophilum]|uniref:uncharacterized protein n=1 Tax=Penicillium coprophilum TaxID=36646 RepID=UPI002387F45D|nr:uncharacterized protein N7500_006339 [Penicillium coprophilum]KAJ5164509.1 hypothetical protein N7500_006339 [Penicillium coprophilum]
MAPKRTDTKARSAVRKPQATTCNFKDEDTMLIWKAFKLTNKEISLTALAEDLNLNVGAARMRWTRLKTRLEAFEKKANENKTAADAAADTAISATDSTSVPASVSTSVPAPVDTTMEGVDDPEEAKGASDDEDEK